MRPPLNTLTKLRQDIAAGVAKETALGLAGPGSAAVSHGECRCPLHAERWSLRFVDLAEVAVYCPECYEREFRPTAPGL